jgi:hypothetical protein
MHGAQGRLGCDTSALRFFVRFRVFVLFVLVVFCFSRGWLVW